MQKPITVARRDFVDSMNKLIAESGLPFSMLCDIFKDAVIQLGQLENEQYEKDKKAYEESLKAKQGDE